MRGRSFKGHTRSLHAPNEPRIIARPSTTHPSLIAEISSLSANVIAKGGIPADTSLFASRIYAYSEASARRYADLLHREIICRFVTAANDALPIASLVGLRMWDLRRIGNAKKCCICVRLNIDRFPWHENYDKRREIKKGNLKVENNKSGVRNII